MKILIIYSGGTGELTNRKSALGSYIACLGGLLEEGLSAEVFVNGKALSKLLKEPSTSQPKEISVEKSPVTKHIGKIIPHFLKRVLSVLSVFRNNRRLLNSLSMDSGKYDKVLEFYTFGSDVGIRYAEKEQVPLFIVYDSPVIEQEVFFKGFTPFLRRVRQNERRTLKGASGILVYSEPVKQHLQRDNKLPDNRFTIHQNVDYTRFDVLPVKESTEHREVNICFLGSFLKWHRIELLIEAFERIKDKNYRVNLHLVGDGMEYRSIQQIVSKSRHRECIHLPGFLDGDELSTYKMKMDIGVMPGSNWYGAPNKIFEYGAAGMAVVSCSTPTIEYVFSGGEIMMFTPDNLEAFTRSLEELLDNPEKINRQAKLLQNFVLQTYTPANTIQAYRLFLGVAGLN